MNRTPTFGTLGPTGTCHENATKHYLRHFGLDENAIVLVDNFDVGIELLHDGAFDYLVQNSAHTGVHIVTEKYHNEFPVVDAFLFPTQEMAILEQADVDEPRTLGIVEACNGYLDGISYPEKIYEEAKPILARKFIEERAYDAALIYIKHHTENPGRFRVRKYIGHVVTAWVVYGRDQVFKGDVLSTLPRDFYQRHVMAGVE